MVIISLRFQCSGQLSPWNCMATKKNILQNKWLSASETCTKLSRKVPVMLRFSISLTWILISKVLEYCNSIKKVQNKNAHLKWVLVFVTCINIRLCLDVLIMLLFADVQRIHQCLMANWFCQFFLLSNYNEARRVKTLASWTPFGDIIDIPFQLR